MKKVFALLVVTAVAIVAIATPFASNVWLLVSGRGFFVPAESSIFSFRPTRMNEGSGEWWLYGEDTQHLFALHPTEPVYVAASRDGQDQCSGFDAEDASTWCSAEKHAVPAR